MKPRMIVLIGERDLEKKAHAGIEASIRLFGQQYPASVGFRWLATALISAGTAQEVLGDADGIWCTPGSPYENTDGALEAIRHARIQQKPFLGTCGGFQHALMEYCTTVLGRAAAHQELDAEAVDPLMVKLSCSLVETRARVLASAGSWYAETVGAGKSMEEFNCNYGLAPAFEHLFAGSPLEFVARDDQGQVRAFHLADHPFFVGTLFQPERRALVGSLHPLVCAFLKHTAQVD
jgi:CTP synthase (UTP-ammonia lyase)